MSLIQRYKQSSHNVPQSLVQEDGRVNSKAPTSLSQSCGTAYERHLVIADVDGRLTAVSRAGHLDPEDDPIGVGAGSTICPVLRFQQDQTYACTSKCV